MLCLPASAEKRVPRDTMKELSDPTSPSYVPYPYPKNRNEIIEDIRYYYVDLKADAKSAFVGGVPINKRISLDIFKPNSKYKFGKIVKVKNRDARLADNYTWLVYITDSDGDAVMRINLMASGLVMGSAAIDKNDFSKYTEKLKKQQKRFLKVLSKKDVKRVLSDSLGFVVDDKQIKKMERIGFFATIGDFQLPLWEIIMKNGTIYYYSEVRDMIYSVGERISWKKDKNGLRPPKMYMVTHRNYLPDTLNDELIVLEEIPRKTK
jgi:hypothetical protein